jgi:hypothetical protein
MNSRRGKPEVGCRHRTSDPALRDGVMVSFEDHHATQDLMSDGRIRRYRIGLRLRIPVSTFARIENAPFDPLPYRRRL